MKKKILFVTYSIHGGGAEKTLQQVLKDLPRGEFEPHLCVFSRTGQEAAAVPADVPVHFVTTSLRPASPFLALKLWRLLRGLRPFRVFSFLWSVNVIALLAGAAAGVPVIANEATVPSESVKRYSFPALRRTLIAFFYRRAAAVVAVSEYSRADLIRNFRLPPEKIVAVHNGVPAAEIERAAGAYAAEPGPYIFSCGSLVSQKNHALLIEAARRVPGARVIIAGQGPEREALLRQAREAGVSLLLPGYLENPYPYFRGASVFVLTSRYEGFGNVLLEAMACGTPVITVDCPGGVREIVADGVTGLVVPQDDPDALGEAIRKVTADRGLAGRLAAAARADLLARFTFKKMLDAYEGLLAGTRAGAGGPLP